MIAGLGERWMTSEPGDVAEPGPIPEEERRDLRRAIADLDRRVRYIEERLELAERQREQRRG